MTMENLHLKLTEKEIELFQAMAQGETVKTYAALANRSYHTMTTYRQRVFRKLGAVTSCQAVAMLVTAGVISVGKQTT